MLFTKPKEFLVGIYFKRLQGQIVVFKIHIHPSICYQKACPETLYSLSFNIYFIDFQLVHLDRVSSPCSDLRPKVREINAFNCSKASKLAGVIKSVNTVALIRPDTKAVAMGAQEMDLFGIPMAMGSRPKVVVMVVIRTGRMRAAQDSMMA